MENKKSNSKFVVIFLLIGMLLASIAIVLIDLMLFPVSLALFVVDLILFIMVITAYNRAVKYRNKVQEGLSLIDIHLKMRFDLVPNLVKVVKGYAKHEKEVFKEVITLRNQAVEATTETDKIDYANKLLSGIKSVVAIAEDYPELKSKSLYKKLMTDLGEIEDRIVASRRIYDSNVNLYNTHIETFPNNVICKCFGFHREKLFKIETGEQIVPNVGIDLNNIE